MHSPSYITLKSQAVPDLGCACIQRDCDQGDGYRVFLELNLFQSHSPRDWLCLRWNEPVLFGTAIVQDKRGILHLIKHFGTDAAPESVFQSDACLNGWAVEFASGWVNSILQAYLRFKTSRF